MLVHASQSHPEHCALSFYFLHSRFHGPDSIVCGRLNANSLISRSLGVSTQHHGLGELVHLKLLDLLSVNGLLHHEHFLVFMPHGIHLAFEHLPLAF